ncbi:RND efflux system, outer membrane lipoprotein, NodT family [Chthoniobacter flavus Ellin428]|uniref:RND efflux system, outer membrane lipoprotein, NodT family n=1 Tax=Chthoniobacter flavus Ellin428 TaxID=497964 RepID=B4CX65_9BACT|nr:efflux transporter outer membrane subunit [Chthoniobacter flavus]EDY20863.1 RND efflux system, outer membrane lipoprotein, NodT family [Chthoniobacter flavus Ellin428]TCO85645.1 NodT family efflux transporter outer membrane factor (OMF) lipoprotein [Chthoniobacter flavus]
MITRTLSTSAACLVLAGCAIKTPPTGANIMAPEVRHQIPGSWSGPHARGAVAPNWIRNFHDPELTALVEDAIARNPDLKAAAANVEASRAAIRIAASSLYPRIALKGLGERQGRELRGDLGVGVDPPDLGSLGVDSSGGSGDTRTTDSSSQRWVYGLGVGASWELDVWGRIRSKKAAATAESGALEADYEYARESLAAAVARAYFTTIEAAQQEANAKETLDLYQQYSKLTEQQKQQGHASDYDVAQIRSRTAGANDTYIAAQAARAQTIRAIEVVTSHYPAGKLATRRDFPGQPKSVPSGLPAQLLERRPDIIAAERRFAATVHRTNEARTARLPRFSLSASSGLGTAQLDGVGVVEALSWSLAAGVVQPIFFGGELKAQQDIRTAEQKAAAATYVSVSLRAFEDVEDALSNDYYLHKREGTLGEMVSASSDAVKLGRQQYDQGHADMFTILRLGGENLAARVELTKVRASRLRERVNLYLALGGDFQGTGAPTK